MVSNPRTKVVISDRGFRYAVNYLASYLFEIASLALHKRVYYGLQDRIKLNLFSSFTVLVRAIQAAFFLHAIATCVGLAPVSLFKMGCFQPLAVLLDPTPGLLPYELHIPLVVKSKGFRAQLKLPADIGNVRPQRGIKDIMTLLVVCQEPRENYVPSPHAQKCVLRSDR